MTQGEAGYQTYVARSGDAAKKCTICLAQLIQGESLVRCNACGLAYHAECWQENGGCAQYGCPNTPETVKHDDPEFQTNIWSEEKPCPSCGRSIKANALKCKFCGATFQTRDYVSPEEYAKRTYIDAEYNRARALLVGLFLASVTGCLSPIAFVLHLVLRYGGSLGPALEYKRLPDELKFLHLAGLAVSALLLVVGFLVFLVGGA